MSDWKKKMGSESCCLQRWRRNYSSHTAYKTDRKYLRIQAHALSRYKNGGKEVGTRSEEKIRQILKRKLGKERLKIAVTILQDIQQ